MTRLAATSLLAAALAGALAPGTARADAPAGSPASVPSPWSPAAVAAAGAAAADPSPSPSPAPSPAPGSEPIPDPAAVEAGEANLESVAARRGMIFTLGFGGGLSIGIGMENATGRGGAFTLRVARVANARSTVALELVGSALFFGIQDTLYRTDDANFLVAGQYYLNQALWLRAGLGVGRYAGDELVKDGLRVRERVRLIGPASSLGAGVDVVRLKRFRASLEFSSTAMLNRDGLLSSSAILLGLTID